MNLPIDDKHDLLSFPLKRLTTWLADNKIAPYRAAQILKWLYLRQADTFDVMTDLNKDLRATLTRHFFILRLKQLSVEKSVDGTQKYLFALGDDNTIESVLIPEKNHSTLCISSQVGCAQGCRFCLTGQAGLKRNLSMGEIIAQVRDIQNDINDQKPLSNIVLMGMGEPLANYENVIDALTVLTDKDYGMGFSNRKVTLSTAGVVPQLANLDRDTRVNLAISLNASNDATRNQLMPINQKYPIADLLEACRGYALAPSRRITFEYILIKDVNDSIKDAKQLARLLKPLKAKINLIPFNPHPGSSFKRPDDASVLAFQAELMAQNYIVMIRKSKGRDISAACGQLRGKRSPVKS
jgi:23S rRNA (adenine2503-C2)-methyltransferase